jgi:polyhydroxyalkanoate synthesis regulator phasin
VIWDKNFRDERLSRRVTLHRIAFCGLSPLSGLTQYLRLSATFSLLLVMLAAVAIPSYGREKDSSHYGEGLIVNVPLPEPEVAQVVEDVAQNTIIRGTKEYNKDEYVANAVAATSTPVFPTWTEGGKVFYKVRKQALDPRNFKDSGDVGTLAVRYVVQPQGDTNTVLRIDAVFVEDFRHGVHPSNGSVESSEYKDIHDRLDAIELMKKENAAALEAKQERLAKQNFGLGSDSDKEVLSTPSTTAGSGAETGGESASRQGSAASVAPQSLPASPSAAAPAAAEMTAPQANYEQQGQSLEQHVAELRRQVERLVKKPGAPLKSAPFHTASTMKTLDPGVEVLILISTPYWYGIETRDGQHGWLRRDQLELVP